MTLAHTILKKNNFVREITIKGMEGVNVHKNLFLNQNKRSKQYGHRLQF
jgi:hypothetical protein